MSGWAVAGVTAGLIVASAFFVVIEFALLGARRHRLEDHAADSRSARAALRGMNELTIMLAGAQLGITVCTFALGAVTKPALDSWLGPLLDAVGLPTWLAGGTAFALSLLLVTFLHLVVGEMAPKSWAIAHPELAARVIGLPSRGFISVFRPFLLWVNRVANRLVARTGVEPVDRAAVGGRDADTIRNLVEYSAKMGVFEPELRRQISDVIALHDLTVGDVVTAQGPPTQVAADATVADVRDAVRVSGHLRILQSDAEGRLTRVVHVRDTLLAEDDEAAARYARPAFVVEADVPVHELLRQLRTQRVQLAVVERDRALVGVVTLTDLVRRVLPGRSGAAAGTDRVGT